MNFENHPIDMVTDLFEEKEVVLSFSKYKYEKDSAFDFRESLEIDSKELSKEWLNKEIAGLKKDFELAFHSKVKSNGRSFHVPMVDFSIEEWDVEEVFSRMIRFIPKDIINNFYIYNSGRSYHGYSSKLLTPREWLNFMGRLLLVNPPEYRSIIDDRWIGHRIIGGYGSLRWSNNTGEYFALPSKISFP